MVRPTLHHEGGHRRRLGLPRQPARLGVGRGGARHPGAHPIARPRAGAARVGHRQAGQLAQELDGASLVVNLAGESIADGRWTAARKQALRDSRINATRSIVTALAGTPHPPATFISGSAVGYYGDRGSEALTEDSTPGTDFLAGLCVDWEAEALRAAGTVRRIVLLRTGLVLEK